MSQHPDRFVERHIGPRQTDIDAMLRTLSCRDLDDLIGRAVPASIRLRSELELAPPLSEVEAMDALVSDAVQRGARIRTGGRRLRNDGFFFQPTVLTDVPLDSRIMNEEPFGPVVPIASFSTFEDAMVEANRLPYGLAAYAYTKSAATIGALGSIVESGMVSINHQGLALPETPFGGIKDSGYGSEGGTEAMDAYLNTKFLTQMHG